MMNEVVMQFIKNDKNQRSIILMLSGILAFGLGYWSKTLPPKSEVCKAEIETVDRQFLQLQAKDKKFAIKLREQIDADDQVCRERIRTEIERNRNQNSIVQCEEVMALYPQCKRQRRRR